MQKKIVGFTNRKEFVIITADNNKYTFKASAGEILSQEKTQPDKSIQSK